MSLSAAGLVVLLLAENFVPQAMIPTRNDRWTAGFGSTYHIDGRPVKQGDRMNVQQALRTAQHHIGQEEKRFKASIPDAELTQDEYDVYMDWIYQYGSTKWLGSSMRRHILQGQYAQACGALLKYKFSGGYDCSIPGNKVCSGVWTRQLDRHAKCMGAT